MQLSEAFASQQVDLTVQIMRQSLVLLVFSFFWSTRSYGVLFLLMEPPVRVSACTAVKLELQAAEANPIGLTIRENE